MEIWIVSPNGGQLPPLSGSSTPPNPIHTSLFFSVLGQRNQRHMRNISPQWWRVRNNSSNENWMSSGTGTGIHDLIWGFKPEDSICNCPRRTLDHLELVLESQIVRAVNGVVGYKTKEKLWLTTTTDHERLQAKFSKISKVGCLTLCLFTYFSHWVRCRAHNKE